MGDEADYAIETADAGASATIPMEAGQIKKGGYVFVASHHFVDGSVRRLSYGELRTFATARMPMSHFHHPKLSATAASHVGSPVQVLISAFSFLL